MKLYRTCFLIWMAIAAHPFIYGDAYNPEKTTMTINKDALKTSIETLFSKERNDQKLEEKQRVRDGIFAYFKNLKSDLSTELNDRVEVSNMKYYEEKSQQNGTNIILTIRGERYGSSDDEILLAGAHYDTQRTAPGVDDNGSGMATLMEIARALKDALAEGSCPLLNSIILVAFDHEEFGLTGSEMFVDNKLTELLQRYEIKTFQGAFILETMMNFNRSENSQGLPMGMQQILPEQYQTISKNGFRGDFLTAITRQDDLPIANILSEQWYKIVGGDFETTEKYRQLIVPIPLQGNPRDRPPHERNMYSHFFRSDHFSFWAHKSNFTQDGLKAVFITDTADFRGFMKECYHNPCDDLSKLTEDNLDFLQIGAEAVLRSLVVLSAGSDDPQCLVSSAETQKIFLSLNIVMMVMLRLVFLD